MDKVTHFEIPFDNGERAGAFYKSVFGWEVSAVDSMPYWMVTTVRTGEDHRPVEAGAINGGMYQRGAGVSPNPVIVVDVPSVEARCAQVVEAGGQVVTPPQDVGTMGRYAQVKDTEGNVIGLWQSLPASQP